MPVRMLTHWSPEYVRAFFRSERADEPLPTVFGNAVACNTFIESVNIRFPNVRLTRIPGHDAVMFEGATEENLMDIIRLAELFAGRVLFPGALPA